MYCTTWETANIQIFIYWAAPGLSCGTRDIQSWLWHAGSLLIACGIWFPDQGSNLGPLHWEHRVLVTGLPGKSMELVFYNYTWTIILNHPVVHLCTLYTVEIVLEFSTSCSPSLCDPTVKNLPAMQETQVRSLGQEDTLEKGMATHSSILAWRIPQTEEPGWLQSPGSQRVRHD